MDPKLRMFQKLDSSVDSKTFADTHASIFYIQQIADSKKIAKMKHMNRVSKIDYSPPFKIFGSKQLPRMKTHLPKVKNSKNTLEGKMRLNSTLQTIGLKS